VHGEIEHREIVSGYQFAKDQYVLIDPDEIEAARPAKDKAISIAAFVNDGAVDASYLTGKNYYLLPDGVVGGKPYALLHRAMVESNRHALAQVVISSREHVAIVRPRGSVLMMSLLAYEEELKNAKEFEDNAPDVQLSAQELKMAKLLTEAMSVSDPELSQYRDRYAEQMREVIERKVAGEEPIVASAPNDMGDRVLNLMDALEKSLRHAKPDKAVKRRKAS
jgi:DNA end-binding protein Ku